MNAYQIVVGVMANKVYNTLVDILNKIVLDKGNIPNKGYTPYTTLKSLEFDELDGVQMIMELETTLEITIPDSLLFIPGNGEEHNKLKTFLSLKDISEKIAQVMNGDYKDDTESRTVNVGLKSSSFQKLRTMSKDRGKIMMKKVNPAGQRGISVSKDLSDLKRKTFSVGSSTLKRESTPTDISNSEDTTIPKVEISPKQKPASDIERLNAEEENAERELKTTSSKVEELNKRLSTLTTEEDPGDKPTRVTHLIGCLIGLSIIWVFIYGILWFISLFLKFVDVWSGYWVSWGSIICVVLALLSWIFGFNDEVKKWETKKNKYESDKRNLEASISRHKDKIQRLKATIQEIRQTKRDGMSNR